MKTNLHINNTYKFTITLFGDVTPSNLGANVPEELGTSCIFTMEEIWVVSEESDVYVLRTEVTVPH